MQGLGNDFMVLDLVTNDVSLSSEQIRHLADRHFGVGFDQLLQIEPASSPEVDFDYRIFNADGNEVEHCGNGARCFVKFVQQRGLTDKNPIKVKTINGVLELETNSDGQVTVNMGSPNFEPAEIPFNSATKAVTYSRTLLENDEEIDVEFASLSMGNPHAVLLVDNVDIAEVERIGKLLGSHPEFPEGVNVGFMQIVDRNTIRLRVFERGVGETLACGTGACAAVVAGCAQGLLDDTVLARLTGGDLTIQWQKNNSPVLMTGLAKNVFEGSIEV
jgi:diaminopimelate epimerase